MFKNNRQQFALKLVLITLVLLFSGYYSFAQDSNDLNNPCSGTDPDMACPIDGGTLILVLVILIFSFLKFRSSRYVNAAK